MSNRRVYESKEKLALKYQDRLLCTSICLLLFVITGCAEVAVTSSYVYGVIKGGDSKAGEMVLHSDPRSVFTAAMAELNEMGRATPLGYKIEPTPGGGRIIGKQVEITVEKWVDPEGTRVVANFGGDNRKRQAGKYLERLSARLKVQKEITAVFGSDIQMVWDAALIELRVMGIAPKEGLKLELGAARGRMALEDRGMIFEKLSQSRGTRVTIYFDTDPQLGRARQLLKAIGERLWDIEAVRRDHNLGSTAL